MITINLSPVRSDDELTASWEASVLTVNGEAFDLSELPDGAEADHPVLGHVTRSGDDYSVVLRCPHGPEQWLSTNRVTPPRYYVGDESFTSESEALTAAQEMEPSTTVEIKRERCFEFASEEQRFPQPVVMTENGKVEIPEPLTDWRTEDTGDVEAFRAEAWPEPEPVPDLPEGELEA